ncbi:MAG: hypothetical protein LBQ80_01425 [Clostridium sp.]|nr:hypothetical protein [Clostridium sp.]
MKQKRDYTRAKHIAAVCGTVVLAALLQTTDGLFPKPFGAAAFLLVPLVVSCAMWESELPSLFYGLLAGLLWDCGNLRFNGHAIFLCLLGCVVSALIRRKMRNTLAVALVLCVPALLGFSLVSWAFSGQAALRLLEYYLPSTVYTLLFVPLFYGLFGAIGRRWRVRSLA